MYLIASNKESKDVSGRKIRPVRLLPPRRKMYNFTIFILNKDIIEKEPQQKLVYVYFRFISEKEVNKTAEQNVQRINSNPADCNDIGMLGYTLNGYYLVNSSVTAGKFGVHFCQFKLPPGAFKSENKL